MPDDVPEELGIPELHDKHVKRKHCPISQKMVPLDLVLRKQMFMGVDYLFCEDDEDVQVFVDYVYHFFCCFFSVFTTFIF